MCFASCSSHHLDLRSCIKLHPTWETYHDLRGPGLELSRSARPAKCAMPWLFENLCTVRLIPSEGFSYPLLCFLPWVLFDSLLFIPMPIIPNMSQLNQVVIGIHGTDLTRMQPAGCWIRSVPGCVTFFHRGRHLPKLRAHRMGHHGERPRWNPGAEFVPKWLKRSQQSREKRDGFGVWTKELAHKLQYSKIA